MNVTWNLTSNNLNSFRGILAVVHLRLRTVLEFLCGCIDRWKNLQLTCYIHYAKYAVDLSARNTLHTILICTFRNALQINDRMECGVVQVIIICIASVIT